MLKIGVLGVGHLGRIHLKCIQMTNKYELVGFYDPNHENSEKTIQEYSVKRFDDVDELINAVDVVDIVTPTVSHFASATKALKQFKHIFIEKPITTNLIEAQELIDLVSEANVKVQVGHVERFNPAFITAQKYLDKPMFIETHRLAEFNPRGIDVPVILDLMIHDIDIILSVVKSTIKKINASGVKVVSDSPDIANARIEFDNGCVANITASRISLKNLRKTRFFQKDAYVSVDFLKKQTEIVRMKDADLTKVNPFDLIIDLGKDKTPKQIFIEKPQINDTNAIKEEFESFYNSIKNDTTPLVTINDGYQALDITLKIMDKINQGANNL